MQLPIKDNVVIKFSDFKQNNIYSSGASNFDNQKIINAVNDQNNPIIAQSVFFSKMFENFVEQDVAIKSQEEIGKNYMELHHEINNKDKQSNPLDNMKEIIYKTYSKSIDKSKTSKKKEKKKLKKIMNLLIYLQMHKVELKLNYFNDFEKLIQFESQQIKSVESQIIKDRIKLAVKKHEILGLTNKLKESLKEIENSLENGTKTHYGELITKAENIKIDNEMKLLDLN